MIKKNNFTSINLRNISLTKFNKIVKTWNLDFLQLGAGKFLADLSQIIYQDYQLGYARFNTTVKQEGTSPEGVWTFAFVNDVKVYWRNFKVHPKSIIVYAPCSEINAVSAANWKVMTFSISEDYLLKIAKEQKMEEFFYSLRSIDLLATKNPLWGELRESLLNEINSQLQNPDSKSDQDFRESFTKKLLVLLKGSIISKDKVSGIKRLKLLHDTEQYILQHITDNIKTTDLALALKVSERTLLYAFKNRFDMGAKAFMKILKLNHVYHRLHNENTIDSIAAIARESGFWHMGQFYKDYKKFFGELPSKTFQNKHVES